ncbi:glycosyltransferase [Candidatus Dojkabacteria bacterium]|uniref:Glycosyltransferase n=1 Tax=Candidatus Dojkabacteria bacterium TaxID=2099670 RepID=A0A3M0Z0K7_9BACT|nr:MAG: glycosyltransferase [Candidatus Dojkabacteria bacterium]
MFGLFLRRSREQTMNNFCSDFQRLSVSVVIPTYNEERFIGSLLSDLKKQTYQNFEIIVADAFSNDKTRQIALSYGAKVIDGGKPSVGRNNGGFAANNELLVFMDADIRVKEDFLEEALRKFLQRRLDIAGGLFDTAKKTIFFKVVYGIWNISKVLRQKSKSPDADGQFMIIKKSVFERLKGFNTELIVGEDFDFVQRSKNMGFVFGILDVMYVPSERRYRRVGFLRVVLGSVLGGVSAGTKHKWLQRISEWIYGGMGSM